MNYARQSIESRLAHASVALTNAGEVAALREELARVSYDAVKLGTGRAFLDGAREACSRVQQKRGELVRASEVQRKTRAEAARSYGAHLAHARIVFREEGDVLVQLGARGKRARMLAAWITQARHFYQTLLERPELVARMAAFGVGEEVLRAGLSRIEAVEAARRARAAAAAASKQATKQRRAAMKELDRYMTTFFALARQALPGDRRLKSLGLSAGA